LSGACDPVTPEVFAPAPLAPSRFLAKIAIENRPEGWNAWVTLAFSPAEKPGSTVTPTIRK
jgi:hypothetical protein